MALKPQPAIYCVCKLHVSFTGKYCPKQPALQTVMLRSACTGALHCDLKKLIELFDRETSLANDPAKSPRFQISPGVTRNDHCSRRVSWKFEHVVTADNPINNKARIGECSNDTPTAGAGQACG